MTLLCNLATDRRGIAVIEMALLLPVLVVVLVGIVDMSTAYSRKLALEQGTQRAIEKIMQTTETSTVEGTLATEVVCQVNGTNDDGTCKTTPITTSNVTVSFREECTNSSGVMTTTTTTDPVAFDALDCPTGSKEARYVQVTATDKYTPSFPLHFASFTNADGTYHISASEGMRTE